MFNIESNTNSYDGKENEKSINRKTWTIGNYYLSKRITTYPDGDVFTDWRVGADKRCTVRMMNDSGNWGGALNIAYNWPSFMATDQEETAEFAKELQTAMTIGAMFQAIYETNN